METVTIPKDFAQALLNLLSEMPYKTSHKHIEGLLHYSQESNDTEGKVPKKAKSE